MSRSITTHIVIRVIMGVFLGIAILAGFTGFFFVAIPAFILSILLNIFLVAERRSLKVDDAKSAKRASDTGNYVVTEKGLESMRSHLGKHPND